MSKKQKNTGVKALCSVLIVLLLATIGIAIPSKGFTDWSKFKKNPQVEQPDKPKPGEEQKPGDGENIKVDQIEANGILLSMAKATAEDGTVSQVITATVTPEDAPDKSVDWSIYWADDAPLKDKDISEYLTLTPTADGALTATITCKKSFRGSVAIIKVETRSGGHRAICMASYDVFLLQYLSVTVNTVLSKSQAQATFARLNAFTALPIIISLLSLLITFSAT